MIRAAFYCALALVATLALQMQGHGPAGKLTGAVGKVGGGIVTAWVRVDSHYVATEFGVTIDESALSTLSDGESETVLALPINVQLPFRTVVIDWHPKGHPPAHVYDVPHFDFHFYSVDETVRKRISAVGPAAGATPRPELLPSGFITDGTTVPMMGKHYISREQPEFSGGVFTASPIYGFYGGHLDFVEAMIARSFLRSGRDLSLPFAQPRSFEHGGRYPTHWAISHDRANHQFTVSFSGLTQH